MKKLLLLIMVILAIGLVGCEQSEVVNEDKTENNEVKPVEEAKDNVLDELKIEMTEIMTSEKIIVPYDMRYSQELLRVLNSYGTEASCYTYMQQNSIFPLFIVNDGSNNHIYEYKDGVANDVTGMVQPDEYDETGAVPYTAAVFELLTVLEEYNDIVSQYNEMKSKPFDTYMEDRYSSNKNLGSVSVAYDEFDAETPGEETCTASIEEGKLKVLVEDKGKNRKTVVTVNGIDDEIAYVKINPTDEVSGIPGLTFILTMKGDVYIADIAEALPEYDEVDVDTVEEVVAVKKENIEKAAAILYSYAYPSGLSLGNSLETRMYALTYDGILYSLNQWTDIDL